MKLNREDRPFSHDYHNVRPDLVKIDMGLQMIKLFFFTLCPAPSRNPGKFFPLFCCLLIFFQKQPFLKNSFRIRVSNSLDPDQAQCFVGPDLAPNGLQRLSADDTMS